MTPERPRTWPAGWTVAAASTHRARGRGLLGRTGLGEREGLWLPVRSVHTFGMRFALDLVWLDRDGRVVRVDVGVGRGRIRTCLRAGGGVVEVAARSGRVLAAALEAAWADAATSRPAPDPARASSSPGRRAGRPSR